MAVEARDTRVRREAQDTLKRNREAIVESERSVGKIREIRVRTGERVDSMTRRLNEAGVSIAPNGQ